MTAPTEQTDQIAAARQAVEPATSQITPPTRRRVLGLAAVVGAAGLAAACGGGSDSTAGSSTGNSSDPAPASSSSAGGGGGAGGGGAKALTKTADVPLHGGKILEGPKIVVTQPDQGVFKAFTAVCTHMACIVGSVEDNVISCPCHGSQYNAKNGQVEAGPAPRAFAAVPVRSNGWRRSSNRPVSSAPAAA